VNPAGGEVIEKKHSRQRHRATEKNLARTPLISRKILFLTEVILYLENLARSKLGVR
jgi:hypothetical protein